MPPTVYPSPLDDILRRLKELEDAVFCLSARPTSNSAYRSTTYATIAVSTFAAQRGLTLDNATASRIGRTCKGRQRRESVITTPVKVKGAYGYVNEYALDIVRDVFRDEGLIP